MTTSKVLIISSEFPPGPGGIGKHAYDMARALNYKGYQVHVYTSQDFCSEQEIDNFNKLNSRLVNINRFSRAGVRTYYNRWSKIQAFLKKEKPEMIIVTGRFSLWMGYAVKIMYGKEFVVHAFTHGSEFSKQNRILHFFTIKALNAADSIWAVSSYTRELVLREVNRLDIAVLPNGLWFDDFTSLNDDTESISLKGNPSLLTVGRLSQRKGQHRVIKSLPVIKSYFTDVRYHMVGIKTEEASLKLLAKNLNVLNDVTIHGRIPSTGMLYNYYKASQVFIMLSEAQPNGDSEGFGIAILEANYFGKPAIGAIGCGIEDAIEDGNNGRLVDGNNPNEILEALRDILDHYDEYTERSRNWARSHDWKNLINKFLNATSSKIQGSIGETAN